MDAATANNSANDSTPAVKIIGMAGSLLSLPLH
jgi:hypothetical protein